MLIPMVDVLDTAEECADWLVSVKGARLEAEILVLQQEPDLTPVSNFVIYDVSYHLVLYRPQSSNFAASYKAIRLRLCGFDALRPLTGTS